MNFWDERFNSAEFIYGTEPNEFVKEYFENNKSLNQKVLFVCEGEGRNSVYTAKLGHDVHAFDSSVVGRQKALDLANKNNVNLNYIISDAREINYDKDYFDKIFLIYAHFPPEFRESVHRNLVKYLKKDGEIIIEAFNPKQLNYNSGGPKNIDILYTESILKSDFIDLEIISLKEENVELNEGEYHKGKAEIIRFIGKKKKEH